MKLLLLSLVLLATGHVIACSPPLPAVMQTIHLGQATSSTAFQMAMTEQISTDYSVQIESINFKGGVNFNLSNGCVINAQSQYEKPTNGGMCPRFQGVVTTTTCL